MAQLCTLDLLRSLPDQQTPSSQISCITFAAPAVGNATLAELVDERGWRDHLVNYLLPGGYSLTNTVTPRASCAVPFSVR